MFNQTNSSSLELRQLQRMYLRVQLFSAILMAILAVVTVAGNGILLLATWKDPFKSFRNPTTCFVVSMGVANVTTGLILEPLAGLFCALVYLQGTTAYKIAPVFHRMVDANVSLSATTLNASYLTVLALTWSQFVAVRFPHRYKEILTNRRACICVIAVWLYAVAFSLLQPLGLDIRTFVEIDQHLNTAPVLVLLVIAYVCLYQAYKNHLNASSFRGANLRKAEASRRRFQKQFTTLNLLLVAFVIFFTTPTAIVSYLLLYWAPSDTNKMYEIYIAHVIAADLLFVKFALDPFAYALRLPKYRHAFKRILCKSRNGVTQGSSFEPFSENAPRFRLRTSINFVDQNKDVLRLEELQAIEESRSSYRLTTI